MGSNNCIASLTRGDTPGDFLAAMVAEFWILCQLHSIDVWIERVRSKLNIADLPTKKVKLPLRVGKTEFPPDILPLLPQCVKFAQNQPFRRIGFLKKFHIEAFFAHSRWICTRGDIFERLDIFQLSSMRCGRPKGLKCFFFFPLQGASAASANECPLSEFFDVAITDGSAAYSA